MAESSGHFSSIPIQAKLQVPVENCTRSRYSKSGRGVEALLSDLSDLARSCSRVLQVEQNQGLRQLRKALDCSFLLAEMFLISLVQFCSRFVA